MKHQSFYNPESSPLIARSEAERLDYMAKVADGVSINQIEQALNEIEVDVVPRNVVDVGAGDSTSLGAMVAGAVYIPVDIRADAVQAHKDAGYKAVRSSATNLDLPSDFGDVFHSRFTFGWLSGAERTKALMEMSRVGHDNYAGIIVDYDWSVVSGPECFEDLIGDVKGIMNMAGFDPEYGANMVGDIDHKMTRMFDASEGENCLTSYKLVHQNRDEIYDGPIGEALPLIDLTARPLLDYLRQSGHDDVLKSLESKLSAVYDFAESNPSDSVKLPDIVSLRFHVDRPENRRTASAETQSAVAALLKHEVLVEGIDFIPIFPGIKGLDNVVVCKSEQLITEARKVQALAYEKDSHVDTEAIDPATGTLIDEIDPQDLVDRSTYITSFGPDILDGTIRLIEPDARGIASLPTIAKLSEKTALYDSLQSHPMFQSSRVGEVSALGKHPLSTDTLAMVRNVIGLAEIAHRKDYEYTVMGIVENRAGMIHLAFGDKAMQRLDGNDALLTVENKHVSDGVRLVPFAVDVKTFLENVREYALERNNQRRSEGKKPAAMFEEIAALADAVIAGRQ